MTRRIQPQAPDRAGTAGMSLLELLVVVAIAGILTLAALPGYRSYLLRAHRVEARSALLAVAAAQEAHYLHHDEYTPELTAAPPVGLGSRSVTDGGNYTITIDRADANAFTATAIAVGKQERDEHCARFSLDANGARTATHADCWLR
jgi:type IV pilus assembly protein PilE